MFFFSQKRNEKLISLPIVEQYDVLKRLLDSLQAADRARQELNRCWSELVQVDPSMLFKRSPVSRTDYVLDSMCIVETVTYRIQSANAGFQKLLGYSSEELARLNLYDILRLDRQSWDRKIRHLILENHSLVEGQSFYRKDGSLMDLDIKLDFLMLHNMPILTIAARDASQRKQAECALQENEETFQRIAESSSSAVFLYQNGQLCYTNSAATAITGYSNDELLSMTLWDFLDAEDVSNVRPFKTHRPIVWCHDMDILTKQGEDRHLSVMATWVTWKGRPTIIGTAVDGTNHPPAKAPIFEAIAP